VVVWQKQRSYEISWSREWFVALGVCVESVEFSNFLEEKETKNSVIRFTSVEEMNHVNVQFIER
jgi:hypothetical protein